MRQARAELGESVRRGETLAVIFSHELADAQMKYVSMLTMLQADHQKLERTRKLTGIGAASRQELEEVTAVHAAHADSDCKTEKDVRKQAEAAYILVEAARRLTAPPDILGVPMLVVAAVGLVVNLAGMWLLHGAAGESLNMKGAYLELMGDALGSAGALVGGVLIVTAGWRVVDPLIAAGVGILLVPRTWRLLREAIDILLEATPSHVSLPLVAGVMVTVDGVIGVHDLHVWTLTSGKYAMSGRVRVREVRMSDRILDELHRILHRDFGIDHTTIQIEHDPLIQINRAAAP